MARDAAGGVGGARRAARRHLMKMESADLLIIVVWVSLVLASVRIVVYWLLGLTWALVVGHLVTKFGLNRIRAFLVAARTAAGDTGTLPWSIGTGVPSWPTGTIERLFFTTAVAFELSGVATAMMAWMGVKLAANWNRRSVASCRCSSR